jgi:uncharacterized protein
VQQPGDPVLLRSIFRDRVRWTFPHTFVGDRDGTLALLLRPGTAGKHTPRDETGSYMADWGSSVPPHDHVWFGERVLWLARRGEAHMLGLFWNDEMHEFNGWYVQLTTPLRESRFGWDTCDRALDVWVEPDGRWEWKDEDDLTEAVTLGYFTADEAAAIRREGERVIAAKPWPTGWEDWRPDPAWPLPTLPEGWNVP